MYELSAHRYRELKHFCLQYAEMKERIKMLDDILEKGEGFDPTGKFASLLTDYKHAVKLIETTAFNVGNFPGEKILKIVTEDKSIGAVCPNEHDICEWYVRKFFWLLSDTKGV